MPMGQVFQYMLAQQQGATWGNGQPALANGQPALANGLLALGNGQFPLGNGEPTLGNRFGLGSGLGGGRGGGNGGSGGNGASGRGTPRCLADLASRGVWGRPSIVARDATARRRPWAVGSRRGRDPNGAATPS